MFTALSAPVFHLDRQGCAICITYTYAVSSSRAEGAIHDSLTECV
jgi:hypothetical protein